MILDPSGTASDEIQARMGLIASLHRRGEVENPSVLGYTRAAVSSLHDGGVKFLVYQQDHEPRHVHGFIGGIGGPEVIVDLKADGTVDLAERDDAVQGANRSEVRKALAAAGRRFVDLGAFWDAMHGA